MCGIAGAFSYFRNAAPVDGNIIARLNDLQKHRGPDGEGLWSSDDGKVVLGHRRLAIIDTAPSGAQPMTDASGRWVITFNGEIYNYAALRSELEQLGCILRTRSDTEVLIQVIATWGEQGLLKLRGMFAFALWDNLERELWLARDPYGIKPLYVAQGADTIWFASQARPLSVSVPIRTTRSAAALVGFYLWGHVPEPFSWWEGIRMFPAGHVQRIKAGASIGKPHGYKLIEDAYAQQPSRALLPGELHDLLFDVVRHHLVSDIPVGIFLSAGIDSNVIAALAAETGARLRTITVAFDEYLGTSNDEGPLAEAAAKALGSDHVTVRVKRDEFDTLLDDFMAAMDQPSIDGLNTYLVSRVAAQQGLKVALSGLGGDELFGGYPSFWQIPMLLRMGRLMPNGGPVGRGMQNLLRVFPAMGSSPKLAGFISHSGSLERAYLLRRALYLEGELETVLDQTWVSAGLEELDTAAMLRQTIKPLLATGGSLHAQISALESCWYMRNQLLRDTDWAGMAHGVEVRVPFVSQHLIDGLGPAISSSRPPSKSDLASCATGIPSEIRLRSKTGFTTPVRSWIAKVRGSEPRGLRGWAARIHRRFRLID